MRVSVGTSGYSYAAWRGKFYPSGLPAKRMLSYYAEHFAAVEINSTFYRVPPAETFAGWAAQVPEDFRFTLKVPGQVTHRKESPESEAALGQFLRASDRLGPRMGPLLFQFAPYVKKDLGRLERLFATLPNPGAAAFEFRHGSWFADDLFELLRSRGAALCLAESDELETPLVSTGSMGYLRLRKSRYGPAALRRWATFIQAQSWSSAYVFFRHEDEALGPQYAATLRSALGLRDGG